MYRLSLLAIIATMPAPAWLNAQTTSDRLDTFFEAAFQQELDLSPMEQAYLGIKKDYGVWDDFSDAAATKSLALSVGHLAELRNNFDPSELDAQSRLSYRLFEDRTERQIASFAWRFHDLPINQMFGMHSYLPSFLINMHPIDSSLDANAYVARLEGTAKVFEQLIAKMRTQRDQGIVPPAFMFPLVIDDCRNVLKGAPFDDAEPSAIYSDFVKKVDALDGLPDGEAEKLKAAARTALLDHVRPAYHRLITALQEIAESASGDAGAWSLPNGDLYYRHCLRQMTTTDLTAEEIHQIGLDEVSRIHGEMRQIIQQVEFDGDLTQFFEFMRESDRFYYANTDAGRQRYLREATEIIDRMRATLDYMFITKPRAEMVVKRVEPFREKSAGTAFYMRGTADGSRPGIYYANLFDMQRMPVYQMEALAFHEGIPGHHMQLSIGQELEGIPKFRRFGGNSAYVEGWGLYCELLPKEFGYYQDPYSDFGRLAMELWRAARLVVDTGIHHHRWSRQAAIDYLVDNTPDAKDECVRAINRYLVMPGQATSYKIGMLKIMELRDRSMRQLGGKFDIREFHDAVLANGAMPLSRLEEQIDAWISAKNAG